MLQWATRELFPFYHVSTHQTRLLQFHSNHLRTAAQYTAASNTCARSLLYEHGYRNGCSLARPISSVSLYHASEVAKNAVDGK